MPEQERLDDAIGILRNHTEVVCLVVVLTPSRPVFCCFIVPRRDLYFNGKQKT